ncbi:MAG: geranylgeranylglyceryl/heptaprenylglyceryl phosphate synthase [Bacteroidota bacterium]
MKRSIQQTLNERSSVGQKSLALLIDPDKVQDLKSLTNLLHMAEECYVDFIFVGGSLLTNNSLPEVIKAAKSSCDIPVILFPGNTMQIDIYADAILYLSLISGRNADLLIGQHVISAPILKNSSLEVLPTGYMLVNSESTSSVSYMSNTQPIPPDKDSVAACTAMAGEMLGLKLIYMDAGSGAKHCIPSKMIRNVRKSIDIPLIVGGGINSPERVKQVLEAGADTIVIGNAIEKNPNLLIEVSEIIYDFNKSLNVH